ncbi:MAG: hypothetical protein KGH66_02450 [Candidatus Micrarchaeota archaeon]|nr:hypothetical protein [Candidatus Micrarchaeota archaeon]
MTDNTEGDRRELVIARLMVLPSNRKIAIGNRGAYTPKELIDHVRKDDEIGKKVVAIEIAFIMALKEGRIYGEVSADNET